MSSLTGLPSDILYNIFPYLDAIDFLSLTSSAKSLLSYSQDPTYWRVLTRRAFRIPPQPLLQADGARWQWLYRNLSTKTRLFTWGSNSKGNLGRVAEDGQLDHRYRWPGTVSFPYDIGVIADVQSGGWATYVLNTRGVIYIFGIFDENPFSANNRSFDSTMRMLKFSKEYHQTTASRYDPQTAIRQFSAGRFHMLGLTDDGRVWSWRSDVGRLVRSSEAEAIPMKKVTRVAAGWDLSSAYIYDIGIVFWKPAPRKSANEMEDLGDYTADMFIIPGTGYRRKPDDRDLNTLESRVGEITNHIVLVNYIVFTTDKDKIFCYPIPSFNLSQPEFFPRSEPIELSTFYPDNPRSPFHIRDLQGSYRSFAVFTDSGSVLMGSRTLLDSHSDHSSPLLSPCVIPGLQGKSVISMAFGDHHFLALNSYGEISSYGIERQSCGSLGLGVMSISYLRGLRHLPGDSRLRRREGRSVWFEPMMIKWLEDMREKMNDDEASERAKMIRRRHEGACAALSDYFEREGRKWEGGITSEGELGAYFVLKVSAAGWSSAALVLVDEEKAEKARRKHIVQAGDGERDSDDGTSYTWSNQRFPRLRMADGEVMPGEISVTD